MVAVAHGRRSPRVIAAILGPCASEPVPLAEYLAASYDPDVAYVDGTLVERNVGDWLHSLIQRNLIVALSRKYPHLFAMPELGSRTKGTRYRPPDVCVLKAPPQGRYLLEG